MASDSGDTSRRDVMLLALCQALLATANTVMITTSALAGQIMAPEGLATLPLGLQFAAVMAATLPASLLMKRIGRRAGFMVGACFGIAAGIGGCLAIIGDHFWWFCVAGVFYGVFMGFGMFYRFAAADASSAAFRPRAISYVMAGGVVAALAGPEIAKATNDLFAPILFAGCYAAIAVLAAVTILVLLGIRIPSPTVEERTETGRPLRQIARQPAFGVALASGALAQGAMILVMTATPLAMMACGHAFDDTAFVIQWHVLGMFAPSFFTGHLIIKWGRQAVMLTGCALILSCFAISLSGIAVTQFWAALALLGVGWNFLFVAATDLLTTTYEPSEKAKVQAANDLVVAGMAALASLSSGAVQYLLGWQAINAIMVLPLLAVIVAIIWLRRHQSRAMATQPALS